MAETRHVVSEHAADDLKPHDVFATQLPEDFFLFLNCLHPRKMGNNRGPEDLGLWDHKTLAEKLVMWFQDAVFPKPHDVLTLTFVCSNVGGHPPSRQKLFPSPTERVPRNRARSSSDPLINPACGFFVALVPPPISLCWEVSPIVPFFRPVSLCSLVLLRKSDHIPRALWGRT